MKTKLTLLSMLIGATLCAQPTIWMMGDSTMASYSRKHVPLTGWGQVLNEYCKPGVKVENMALSGWSTTMFMKKNEKTGKSRFDTFVDKIKPGPVRAQRPEEIRPEAICVSRKIPGIYDVFRE